MRWVDRGPEPGGVAGYARQFTQGWVDHVERRAVGRPTDSYWREFRPTLGSRTNNICWYCERQCDANAVSGGKVPTVDHFRPLSRFPHLAYDWSNWVFSCYRCNVENKRDSWPGSGYVDPCANVVTERPEQFFDYDAYTGDLVPKNGLSATARGKAMATIGDLGLNQVDVRYYRIDWTRQFTMDLLSLAAPDKQDFIAEFMGQTVEYAGVTGMVVEQLRRDGRI